MKLTAKQADAIQLLQTPAKHILLDGGSRSGKTRLFVYAMCHRALKAPGSRHVILRFRFSHAVQSIGMDTLPKVMKEEFPQIPASMNKSDWYLPLPNGSEIWIGGIDDKERTEKILGKEFATILLNECSQIPYASRNLVVTRLAQKVDCKTQDEAGNVSVRPLALKMYYDQNPPSKSHWAYQLFYLHRDPDSKQVIDNAQDYARMTINPRDNAENLPAEYIRELEKLPKRLRDRFLDGLYGDTAADALWTEEMIERWRHDSDPPRMVRIVVAVDPSGSGDEDNAHNDEIGIIVAGLGIDGNGYVLEDATVKAGPKVWGDVATSAYDRHMANVIVAETNFGGEMVKFVVQSAKPGVPFKKLTASRGKSVRAEPISALTETGKIRFCGRFLQLEDELCGFTSRGYLGQNSPNRADAFVWAMSELFPGIAKAEKKAKGNQVEQVLGWMG